MRAGSIEIGTILSLNRKDKSCMKYRSGRDGGGKKTEKRAGVRIEMRKRKEITGGMRGQEELGGESQSNGEGIMNTEKINRRQRER